MLSRGSASHCGIREDGNEYDVYIHLEASLNKLHNFDIFLTRLLYNKPYYLLVYGKVKYAVSPEFLHRARKFLPGIYSDKLFLNAV